MAHRAIGRSSAFGELRRWDRGIREWAVIPRPLARQQLGQLCDVRRDPLGLVVREHVRLPGLARVVADVGVGERLPGGVLDAERLLKLADGPGCGEAADRHRSHTRVIAGLSGFFTLINVLTRPER